jgi:hypothetical protein
MRKIFISVVLSFSTMFATEWGYQGGSSATDMDPKIAVSPNGDLFVCGGTTGNLYRTNNNSSWDVFFEVINSETGSKFVAGIQFGNSNENDNCYAVATDSSSNMYIAGYVTGAIFGTVIGANDMFIAKYSNRGTKIWGKQFGSSAYDTVRGLVIDEQGNIYISGYTSGNFGGTIVGTYDAYVAKYDNNGNQIWISQFGLSNKSTYGFNVDLDSDGNVYLLGQTDGDLFATNTVNRDIFIVKYSNNGTKIWGKQYSSSGYETAYNLKVDSFGNIYVTGSTSGDLFASNIGGNDMFFAKYDNDGNQVWGKQFGDPDNDYGSAIGIDPYGYIYFGGYSYTLFDGGLGSFDVFVLKYNQNGDLIQTRNFGTSAADYIKSLAFDNLGNLYVAGNTTGDLFSTNAGGTDFYVRRYDFINMVSEASLDLSNYKRVKLGFLQNLATDSDIVSKVTNDFADGTISIGNRFTENDILLQYDFNTSENIYATVTNSDDVLKIRGNTYNNLVLKVNDIHFENTNLASEEFPILEDLGEFPIEYEKWNLITMPKNFQTNSREFIKANKASSVWGWELNDSGNYNWINAPSRMVAGRGYWVKTNEDRFNIESLAVSDFNNTIIGDYDSSEINSSNLIELIKMMPKKHEWVLLGNGSSDINITSIAGNENNSTTFYFGDLINKNENCLSVSIFHWNAIDEVWINDYVDSEKTISTIPSLSGFWAKQHLCDN